MNLKNCAKSLSIMIAIAQFFCAYLLFFNFDAMAQFSRQTTFDERSNCEATKGIWREFGDDCVDDCEAQFDEFAICDRSTHFSCDCGKGRCFNEGKCILMSEYKKIYQKNLEKEQKILDKKKEERAADAKLNAEIITERLIQSTESRAMSIDIEGAANNYADFYHNTIDNIKNNEVVGAVTDSMQDQFNEMESLGNDIAKMSQEAPPIVVDTSNAKVPPAFLKQEELKEQQNNNSANNSNIINSGNNSGQNVARDNLGLPVIPLPQ